MSNSGKRRYVSKTRKYVTYHFFLLALPKHLPHLPSESVFVRLNRRFPEHTVIFQYIEMVEIDGVVMRECAKHMRATAGDSMDNYNGDNYQIFCEDCIPRLTSL